jgi:hypothetical protein
MRYPVINICQSMHDARAIGLPEFAQSFDHDLKSAYPVLVATVDGQLRGYAQLERRWLMTPAIHPEINSPRDMFRLAQATFNLMRQTDPGFLVQRDSLRDTIFTDSIMAKLGLKPWPYRVYQSL